MIIFIAAKSISKRIPRKNLQTLAHGYSLLSWTIENWKGMYLASQIVVATEDEETKTLVASMGCSHYDLTDADIHDRRTASLLLQEFTGRTTERPIILTECTAPFTFYRDVRMALEMPDDVIRSGVVTIRHREPYKMSQDIEPDVSVTGNFIIVRGDISQGEEWGVPKCIYPVNQISAINIDTPEDLEMARWLAQRITLNDLRN